MSEIKSLDSVWKFNIHHMKNPRNRALSKCFVCKIFPRFHLSWLICDYYLLEYGFATGTRTIDILCGVVFFDINILSTCYWIALLFPPINHSIPYIIFCSFAQPYDTINWSNEIAMLPALMNNSTTSPLFVDYDSQFCL